MTSLSADRPGWAPRFRNVPEAVSHEAGKEAIELAVSAGLFVDPWQERALIDYLGETIDGKWAAFEPVMIMPRQNGKGVLLEIRELAGLFLFGEELILHSAHEFKTAAEAFRRVLSLVVNTPDLERRVAKVRTSHGDEGIELKTGQRLRFVARSTGSGRGFSGDCVILDEAYNLSARAMSALLPTMSARPNPQLWYTSSAPLVGPESDVLRRLCKRGRGGESKSLAYIEYSCDPSAPLDDPQSWAQANPAIDIRITREFIAHELEAMEAGDFARERLGVWAEDDKSHGVISAAAWAACEDKKSGPVGHLSFALDVSPDRAWSTIAVAAGSGRGGVHVEITGDEDVFDHRPGTDWLVERAVELQAKWGGKFAIAKGSPAWSLETELIEAEVDLLPASTAEHAQACGDLFDAITNRELRHIGQAELDAAVAGADRRFYGDAWLWSRKTSAVDISPLVAVTLACWAHGQDEQYDALDSVA